MTTIKVQGDISPEDVQKALIAIYGDKKVVIGESESPEEGTLHVSLFTPGTENAGSAAELAETKKQLKQSETISEKALASIQTFHKQQKALFDEFVLLRQRYDDMKTSLLDVLWVHCSMHHPDLRQIPDIEDMSTFVLNENQIGRYEVGEVLGEGQFATVKSCYFEERNGQRQELALKIINKDQISSFVALKRVSNEIGTLKRLQSDFIVRVTDVFQTNSHLYIVTEKGGMDLFAFFDEHPDGVPESWALHITTAILRAVLFCHARGICHRDLKPENILVEFDDENEKCLDLKLCDFGLSTSYVAPGTSQHVLLSDFCGSPGFFAPEMITNEVYYGDSADLWSSGCILLELVLGHQKFCDLWMVAYDFEIMQEKARFAQEISQSVEMLPSNLHFSDSMNSFVVRLLDLNPDTRASGREVVSHGWINGELDDVTLSAEKSNSVPVLLTTTIPTSEDVIDTTSGMSNRERRLLQQYSKDNQGEISLPPIEPATPSLYGARKILKSGDKLANQAATGNWDANKSPMGHHLSGGFGPNGNSSGESVDSPAGMSTNSPDIRIQPGGRFGRAISMDYAAMDNINEHFEAEHG